MAITPELRRRLQQAMTDKLYGDELADVVNAASVLSGTETAFIDGVTPGTGAASKAVVLDADKKIDALDITALTLGGTLLTSTATDINMIDGVTATAAELNFLDGVTTATATANKALVLGANKDVDELDITALSVNGDVWSKAAVVGTTTTSVTTTWLKSTLVSALVNLKAGNLMADS